MYRICRQGCAVAVFAAEGGAGAALRIRMEARMQTSKKIRTAGRQLCWLSLSCIRPNAQQPRQEFDEFALLELAASIKENGLLQPVTVRPCEDGYELIMGERRCRACRMLGHTHIEAFILPADDEESALLALVENMQRRDLHFFEEAQAYERLCEKGMTQEMLSRMLGKSAGAVNNRLRLLKLEPAVRELIVENHLSERHARALLPLPASPMIPMSLSLGLRYIWAKYCPRAYIRWAPRGA